MKKLKLLIGIAALLLGGANSVNAQGLEDITDSKIVNANLSAGSSSGWTTVTNINNWNTGTSPVTAECYSDNIKRASYEITQTITLDAGSYRLEGYGFLRDGGSAKLIANVEGGTSNEVAIAVRSGQYKSEPNSMGDAAKAFKANMYKNVVEFTLASSSTVKVGFIGTHTNNIGWFIAGPVKLYKVKDEVSAIYPNDITHTIDRSYSAWTRTTEDVSGGGSYGADVFLHEVYKESAFTATDIFSKTYSGLENGAYELKLYAAASCAWGKSSVPASKPYVYAQDSKYEIEVAVRNSVPTAEEITLSNVKVFDGTLKVGLKTTAEGSNWIIFNLASVKYLGDPLKAAKDLLTVAVEKAQALVNGNTIPTAAEEALQAVIDANDNDDNAFTTEDQFNTAVGKINTAYDTYKALESAYSLWLEAKTGAEALVLVENNNATATSTLNTAIGTQNAAAEAATTADGINTATADLKTAILNFAKAADPTSGNRFNLTCLLTNHDVTGLPTWTGASGWYTDQTGGNSQVMTNDGVKSDDGKNAFYEYWSETPAANNKFTLYQKLTLPQGTYSIKCYAFSDQPTGGDNRGVYFYANDTQGSLVNNSKLTEQGISFINDEEQEVKIGLKALTGNTYRWMGIGYVELYKEYTDNTTFTITTNTIANGTVAVTVDGAAATSAKALKTVTLTYSPETGYRVSNVVATYNDGEKDVNLDVANPSESVYTFQMPAYNVTVNTTTVVDKRELAANIETAAGLIDKNVGTGVFQIPSDANEALKSAKSAAETVNSNAAATVSDVTSANSTLATAISTFRGAALNAPAADKRYNLTIVEEGKAWNGNAITFIAGARTAETQGGEMGGYGIKYLAPANANLNQALKFTAVDGEVNTYKVSAVNAATGAEQYLTTGSTYGGNNDQIRTTDDASKAMWIKAEATTTGGQFQIRNMTANKIIANNNNNDMYTANSVNFTIAEASQATVNVTIAADVKYATRIFPFTPALPSGVKAYSCEAATDATLTLVEVAAPAANVPYILEAESGCASTDLTGWGTAGAETYTTGWLTGVYTATDAPVASYVLQNNDSKVAFYVVADGEQPTVGANRCYLTVPSAARPAFFFGDDNTTGIEAINALTNGTAEIYNVNGVKVPALQKGMNIVKTANGKTQKILVK